MPTNNIGKTQENYDPRWFIWTIVFLVTTGISLVTYIVTSDSGADTSAIVIKGANHKVVNN